MTREERHIAVLNRMLESMDVYDSILSTTERKKAIKAAIQALSQEPTDTWSIKEIADTFKKHGLIREQEPCDDAVSREAVCEIISDIRDCISVEGYCAIIERLKKLPSVNPQPSEHFIDGVHAMGYREGYKDAQKQKLGKWIKVYQGDEIINYRCSECELGDTNGSINLYGWDYCRRCGAKTESDEKKRDTDDSTEKH